MQTVLRRTFLQLLIVYVLVVNLFYWGILPRTALHLGLFAVVLGGIGGAALSPKRSRKHLPLWLVFAGIALFTLIRVISYDGSPVPLGYDPGIYKLSIEHHFAGMSTEIAFPQGFLSLTDTLLALGYSSWEILVPVFIIFQICLLLGVYLATKAWLGRDAGIVATLLMSVSVTQFQTFWYLYYKNVVAIFLLSVAVYLMKERENDIALVLIGGMIGGIHRPTFLLFGLIYLVDMAFRSRQHFWRDAVVGACTLLIAVLFSLHDVFGLIAAPLRDLASGTGPGTFFSLADYQLLTLIYIPFAVIGTVILLRTRAYSPILSWATIGLLIVFGKLFFYNRFIIMLDIAVLMLAAYGIVVLLLRHRWIGSIALTLLLISSSALVSQKMLSQGPMISDAELEVIESLQTLPENASVVATDSYYSPWIFGYSARRTIAPGLFSANRWNLSGWQQFWQGDIRMLSEYEGPLYLYSGAKRPFPADHECLEPLWERAGSHLYRYVCS
ncbi:MAG: hypothetical protein ACOCWQ_04965 [Nanoarchaeota archaeon]